MFHQLIQFNYATIVLIFCLLIFIVTNDYFDKKVRILFLTSSLMIVCLVLADSIEYWTSTLAVPTKLRIWMSAIGYSLRPTVIFVVILLLLRKQNMKKLLWLMAPLFLIVFEHCLFLFS